jgi:hypothetical protein
MLDQFSSSNYDWNITCWKGKDISKTSAVSLEIKLLAGFCTNVKQISPGEFAMSGWYWDDTCVIPCYTRGDTMAARDLVVHRSQNPTQLISCTATLHAKSQYRSEKMWTCTFMCCGSHARCSFKGLKPGRTWAGTCAKRKKNGSERGGVQFYRQPPCTWSM